MMFITNQKILVHVRSSSSILYVIKYPHVKEQPKHCYDFEVFVCSMTTGQYSSFDGKWPMAWSCFLWLLGMESHINKPVQLFNFVRTHLHCLGNGHVI